MVNNELKSGVDSPTRIQTNFYKKDNIYKTSSTLIDVIMCNQDFVAQTIVIDCPFSDHCFVASSLSITQVKLEAQSIMCRNLSEPVLEQIIAEFESINLKISPLHDVESNWTKIKLEINKIINKLALMKRKLLKNTNQFPWIDKELVVVQNIREFYYASFKKSMNVSELELYKEYRTLYQSLNRAKMKDYFASKTQKDFKNSKKF
jgi:hypothetical protein